MNSKDFIKNISRSLGRDADAPPVPDVATHLSLGEEQVQRRAQRVADDMKVRASELMSTLEQTAAQAGWNVVRLNSPAAAAQHIRQIAQDMEARTMLRSAHPSLDALHMEAALFGMGITLGLMAIGDADALPKDDMRQEFRQKAIHADIGLTGVDYAIAETGSCVLLPRKGVSRVVSLLPPVHIAVVESGQVLPSLDELFTLRRSDFLNGNLGSYMNLISGPSRSADIEYTIVTGVHGPGEVHLILLD